MTSIERSFRTARRLNRNAHTATGTALNGGEMLHASGQVIAARMDILARGMADPMRADLTEVALMGSEKVEALTASAAATGHALTEIGAALGRDAFNEAAVASRALAKLSAAKTPVEAARVQMTWALGWWGRAASQALTANTRLLKAQADALAPLHRAAVANAKRLKR